MISAQSFTFVEQLLLNVAGPLLTALVVGFGAAEVFRRAQIRRENVLRESDRRRAEQAVHLERLREDHDLRDRLISQAIEAPSALYLASQHYWRAKDDDLPADQLAEYRAALDARYLDSRREGLVLEHRLRLHFADPKPCRLSHRLMDLLTIRYFQLVRPDGASENLRNKNSGEAHTGLSAADLAVASKVLAKYHTTIDELVAAVADGALRQTPSEK